MNQLHVARNRQKLGEFSEAEVIEGLNSGRFLPTDIAWAPPMAEWVPLSEYKFGAAASFSTPPAAAPLSTGFTTPSTEVVGRGIPWDNTGSGRYVSDWWQTTVDTLLSPIQTFQSAQITGGYVKPLTFLAIGGTLGGIMTLLVQGVANFTTSNSSVKDLLVQIPLSILCGLILIPLFAVIGGFIGGGIFHLCLMILGGAKEGFEATMRAYCYTCGATQTLGLIPLIGSFAAIFWFPVVLTIAAKEMHKTEYWKVIVAILIPIILCCGLLILGAGAAIAAVSHR